MQSTATGLVDANGQPLSTRPVAGQPNAPETLSFGGIIEFNDLRLGVENFTVRFGTAARRSRARSRSAPAA